jgi:hypothetical protein
MLEKTYLFVKLIFFPPKLFFGILEKGNLSEQKKIWREKINLAKIIFPLENILLNTF